jgi:hypothetical protein
MLWWRCPRCYTSFNNRWRIRIRKECPERALDLISAAHSHIRMRVTFGD